mmetsp:Transcript_12693/g.24410  ORF Transcript_12693/g.24410 Transcript_12693/m.24410 type:complete len:129 (-) Transcript_12693:111-497(-)|eukprot:scaffold32086_cov183-Amphora_coffeaeformis.AAC.16
MVKAKNVALQKYPLTSDAGWFGFFTDRPDNTVQNNVFSLDGNELVLRQSFDALAEKEYKLYRERLWGLHGMELIGMFPATRPATVESNIYENNIDTGCLVRRLLCPIDSFCFSQTLSNHLCCDREFWY